MIVFKKCTSIEKRAFQFKTFLWILSSKPYRVLQRAPETQFGQYVAAAACARQRCFKAERSWEKRGDARAYSERARSRQDTLASQCVLPAQLNQDVAGLCWLQPTKLRKVVLDQKYSSQGRFKRSLISFETCRDKFVMWSFLRDRTNTIFLCSCTLTIMLDVDVEKVICF